MTSAGYCSQYIHVNSGRRYVCDGGSRLRKPVFGIVRPVASADPLVGVTVLDGQGQSRPSSRTIDDVQTDDERSSLLPIESVGFIGELSAVASTYNYSKELSEQQLKKPRQRQNAQRISNTCLRTSISFDVVAPNLSISSKGRREYTDRKAVARHRATRLLLPPSDARQNHIFHQDLNSAVLVGRQILNPPKVPNFYSLNKDLFPAEKSDRTLKLTSLYGNNGTGHKCDQPLQRHQQQQQPIEKEAGEGPNIGRQQQQSLSSRLQMPAISKKLNTRSGMSSLSNSMPSIKVAPKPVAPCYVDPIVNCPHSFHHRITELMALEFDTIAWEKSRKLRKKIREHS